MKLPPGLAPWASQLKIFPDEVSITLGELARRISAFVSPFKPLGAHDDGEPNGYDGVARRGIYDRLLLSELALADEFSDEFIRRAVMGEHLFLNVARVAEGEKRVSVVLFDAGALQIGTPRLAQLAAFIVFARRAEAANAAFCWGILQDTKQLILADDTEASIKILLESRVARAVSEDDLDEWDAKLADVRGRADVWLVGSEEIGRLDGATEFSHLFIDEVLDPEKRELAVSVKSATGIEKRIQLELPSDDLSTRILRNPFDLVAPALLRPSISEINGSFFFDGFGSKLFIRSTRSSVKYIDVHNQSVEQLGMTGTAEEAKQMMAVGRLRKSVVGAQYVDPTTIRLANFRGKSNLKDGLYVSDLRNIVAPDGVEELLPIVNVRPHDFHYSEAGLIDAEGKLFMIDPIPSEKAKAAGAVGSLRVVAIGVLAFVVTRQGLFYVGLDDGGSRHVFVTMGKTITRRELGFHQLRSAVFGRGGTSIPIVAFEDVSGDWTILDDEAKEITIPRPPGKVVGVISDQRVSPLVGLLVLGDDRRQLLFCDAKGTRRVLLVAESDIVRFQQNPFAPMFAYQTEGGQLVLHSYIRHRAIQVFGA